jgi:hypothetical protein
MALSRCNLQFSNDFAAALKTVQDAPKGDAFATLDALEALEKQMQSYDGVALDPTTQVVSRLAKIGWRGLVVIFYRLKDQRAAEVAGGAPPT